MSETFDEDDIPFGDDLEPPDPNRPDWEDGFHPPSVPTEVWCFHCREVFESYLMERRPIQGMEGEHWCCPTPGCDAVGFGFDIWPTDPNWIDPDNRGMHMSFDDDDDEEDDDGFDDAVAFDDLEPDAADWWKQGDGEDSLPF